VTTDAERSYSELAEMWLKGERSWWNTFAGSDDAEARCQAADIATANTYALLALADAINAKSGTQTIDPKGVLFIGEVRV